MDIRQQRNKRGNMAEFPVGLFIFFMFFVFPLINLMFFAVASGTVAFITTQAAGSAAAQANFNNALSAMQTTTQNMTASNWGKFVKLTPTGGYNGSGPDLYVVETPIGGGTSNYYGPNSLSGLTLNPSADIYEYRVRTNYSIAPFMNLACVPFIGNVPLVGSAVNLSWNVERSVEMAYSQSANSNNGGGGGLGGPPNGGPTGPGGNPGGNAGASLPPLIATPPGGNPISTPPGGNPISTPPGGNPVTTPPTMNIVPPGGNPLTTPPINNGPPGGNPLTTPPINNGPPGGPPGGQPLSVPPGGGPNTGITL